MKNEEKTDLILHSKFGVPEISNFKFQMKIEKCGDPQIFLLICDSKFSFRRVEKPSRRSDFDSCKSAD